MEMLLYAVSPVGVSINYVGYLQLCKNMTPFNRGVEK